MKTLAIFVTISFFCVSAIYAQRNNLQESINKGKSDLLEILQKQQFSLEVNAEELREANPTNAIPFHLMKFESLLNYRSGGIEPLIGEREKIVVPLARGERIVTTISLEEKEAGNFEVIELILPQYTSELNMIMSQIGNNDLRIVEVPNLRATLYLVNDRIYTSYKNREIRRAQEPERLLNELMTEAKEFQEKYGDQLRRGKLVD